MNILSIITQILVLMNAVVNIVITFHRVKKSSERKRKFYLTPAKAIGRITKSIQTIPGSFT